MTMTEAPVAKLSEIPVGKMKVVTVGGSDIALCNVEGKIYAIDNVCTHADGPLGEGTLEGHEVECPWHGAHFDVQTGAAVRMPAVAPVKTFRVKVEGDSIFVEVDHGA